MRLDINAFFPGYRVLPGEADLAAALALCQEQSLPTTGTLEFSPPWRTCGKI